MLDIKLIRNEPDRVREALRRRGEHAEAALDKLLGKVPYLNGGFFVSALGKVDGNAGLVAAWVAGEVTRAAGSASHPARAAAARCSRRA